MKNRFLKFSLILTLVCTIISGFTYLGFQYFNNGIIKDLWYVVLLMISTSILLIGVFLINTYVNNAVKEVKLEKILMPIVNSMNSNYSLLFGLLVGVGAIIAFFFILQVWPDNQVLGLMLSVFQFFVGIICGFGMYQLVFFIYTLKNVTKDLNISFFNLHSPEIFYVLNSIQYIALLTSIYVSLSMTSIIFSHLFDFSNAYIFMYSIFSFSFILIAYLIPLIPISQKIKKTKNKTLYEIEKKLLHIYENEIQIGKSTEEELAKFESFITFRSEILEINSWPFTNKWLTTVAGVLLASLAPILIEMLIN